MTTKPRSDERTEAIANVIEQAAMVADVDNWQHRCSDRVGGCTAVSESRLEALRLALEPFRQGERFADFSGEGERP